MIKKGDTIYIRTGKDRGKTGIVIRILGKNGRVTVEGMNLYKKRVRPRRDKQKGETVLVARPLSYSNLLLYCATCKRGVRHGYRIEGATKVRQCKRCGTAL